MATKKKRIRVWTPEDRAAHRVFERSRREAFNDSLIDLARRVPSLARTRRLNKHMIVEHSIARLQSERQMCIAAAKELQDLVAERDELLAEVNHWRSASGAPFSPREARLLGEHLQNLKRAENEVFGTFPKGFGENPPEHGSGDDQDQDEHTSDEASRLISPTDETPSFNLAGGSGLDEGLAGPLGSSHPVEVPSTYPDMFSLDDILGLDNSNDFGPLAGDRIGHAIPETLPLDLHQGTHSGVPIMGRFHTAIHGDVRDDFHFQGSIDAHVPINAFDNAAPPPHEQFQAPYHGLGNSSRLVHQT